MAKAQNLKKVAPKKAPAKKSTSKKVAPKKDAATQLADLLEHGLQDIYWAEKALVKALTKLSKNTSSPDLKVAVDKHQKETQGHVAILEDVFKSLGKKAKAKKCDAMQGLIEEADGILEETTPGAVRDAAIIGAAQKVEHYEIATYGTLATYAKALNEKNALNNLLKILQQEKACDETLTELAKADINISAI
ncbi:YciE/YciF ferroxidase family protein [Niabella ginsengisoli]|uniref:Ferritin-like domain-containing protein n=1 Tax=Niabella ginsengisoli TaxID=522298 RepID=A0ABS9SGQ8_9BACT|nr:ferritin-like domain-containing protein [Niabella ginsengisoli]MCH5597530.1 ferritin-like domain-containing protein [Niabella ginsengisoli]